MTKIQDMILDTDTYNEVDDQFALCYSILSPERVNVQAVTAAPFFNSRSTDAGDGMEKSYNEITRLLGVMGVDPEGFAWKGSQRFWQSDDDCVDSPAARRIVELAMSRPEGREPLWVCAIAAITNVASALKLEPAIAKKIHIVWLAGQMMHADSAREFNLSGDIYASRYIMDSDVPLTLIPCGGVASHLLTTVPELECWLGGKNKLCDTLIELFKAYSDDHFAWAKEIWDISTIAYMINRDWASTVLVHRPHLSLESNWSHDNRRGMMEVVTSMRRNAIYKDMFTKLAAFGNH